MKGEPKCSSCVSQLSGKPSKLIRSELHKLDGHLLHSEDIRSVAQSLYRARRKIHSSLPTSREDVHNAIELMDTRKSKDDEEFVITNDVPSDLIIFSCSSDLEFLTNSAEDIFVDGTFSFCPKFVYQLYTIHRFRNGRFVPLVVGLLSVNLRQCTEICSTQPAMSRKTERDRTGYALAQFSKYSAGEITRLDYIKSLGYRFLLPGQICK